MKVGKEVLDMLSQELMYLSKKELVSRLAKLLASLRTVKVNQNKNHEPEEQHELARAESTLNSRIGEIRAELNLRQPLSDEKFEQLKSEIMSELLFDSSLRR